MKQNTSSMGLLGLGLAALCLIAAAWTLYTGSASGAESLFIAVEASGATHLGR
ncbi:hypothetical protein [Oceanicaulis alexandrii]|uniref:hypothetical protein n=1 Tax=Oceanicaulis alexandrii TaxID=153233 RepID=UPI000400F168|nr:hypothetical protein [Oceanicaulis alexandrii]VXC69931.1 conserved hypothetical protein [Oceanicaulis sp. 350]